MPISIEGLQELKDTIKKMEKAIDPKIETMAQVSRIILDSIDRTFATNGHGTWAAQAPSTRPGKGGTLEFTSALRGSMQPRIGRNYAEVKPSNAVYKYGAVNHYGSKSGRIPARPFMRLWPEDLEEIMRTYVAPIDEAMK